MTFDDFWGLESVLVDFWMRRIQWHNRFVISLHESVWVTFHLMPHWLVEAIMQNSRNISNNLFASTSQLMWMWCTVSSFANSQAVHVSNVSSMHMEYPVRGWRNLWLALAWIEIPSRTCLFLFGSWSMCLFGIFFDFVWKFTPQLLWTIGGVQIDYKMSLLQLDCVPMKKFKPFVVCVSFYFPGQ